MDSIDFVNNYPSYVKMVEKTVKPEYYPVIRAMYKTDPHELIEPDHYFSSAHEAIGYVFILFYKKIR